MGKYKIPPLCGSSEAADILKVKRTSIPSMRKLKGFPDAIQDLIGGPIFIQSEIEEYEKTRNKRNHRTEDEVHV